MTTLKLTLLAAAGAALLLAGCNSEAQDDAPVAGEYASAEVVPVSFNLEPLTCWDVTTLEEEEAGYALVLLYGYLSGKSGSDLMKSAEIEKTIGDTVTFCDANPDAIVLDVMAKAKP